MNNPGQIIYLILALFYLVFGSYLLLGGMDRIKLNEKTKQKFKKRKKLAIIIGLALLGGGIWLLCIVFF